MALVQEIYPNECEAYAPDELKLSEVPSPGETVDLCEGDITEQITALIRVDGKGWNIAIFVDKKHLPICPECKHVCRDAVELGCKHRDEDIELFCHDCLGDLIAENDGKCPLDDECEPIINRCIGQRRQILQFAVSCPYSAVHDSTPDGSASGCHFRGSLADLIGSHLLQCGM